MPRKKRFPLECQSPANQEPIDSELPRHRRRNPTPREEILLTRLAEGNSTSKALKAAGFCPTSKTLRTRLEPEGDLGQEYAKRMIDKGLNLDVPLDKLKSLMDATKHVTIAGEAKECADNDAQLRATDMVLKLQQNTGLAPSKRESAISTPQMTINILTAPPSVNTQS